MTSLDIVKRQALAWALVLGITPSLVQALGLGNITTRSYLMEPLLAEIPLQLASPAEAEDAVIRLGKPEQFERFGIDRTLLHEDMRFEVESRGGSWVILVRTVQPVREPFLAFPLSAVWRDGQLLREYTVFLDPRPAQRAATVARREPPVATPPAPSQTAPAPAAGQAVYGPVRRGETAWPIAQQLKPAGVTSQQMLMALQRANPDAFVDGNVNNLRAGAVLRVPGADEIAAMSAAQARATFQAQNEAWKNRGRVAAAPAPRPIEPVAPAVAPTPAPEATASEPEPPPAADAPALAAGSGEQRDSELRILKEDAEQAAGAATATEEISLERAELERRLLLTLESAEATRIEFRSLNDEVTRLTAQMEQMQRLLALKERQIAALTAVKQATERAAEPVTPTPAAAARAQPAAAPAPPRVVQAQGPTPAPAVDSLQTWWFAVIIVVLLVLILVLLVLLWRRSGSGASGRGSGALPEQDRPYASQVAAYTTGAVGAASVAEADLNAAFVGEDAQRFLDELERSAPAPARGAQPSPRRPAAETADDGDFPLSDADIAELGRDISDEEMDEFMKQAAPAEDDAAPSADIDDMLKELGSSTEHDEVVDELTVEEPVVDRDEQIPELDLSLDIDALEGVEQVETDSGPGERFELPDEVNEPVAPKTGDEDDAEAMELKLELARAYLEIGDVEGARDILGKVVEGSMSGDQLEEARALLKALK